jgi:DNA-binding CsgD family transcriptional regulator
MGGRLGCGDLLAGGAAAAVFLLVVFALELNTLLAIVLAVVTYVGVLLLRMRDEPSHTMTDGAGPEERAFQAALANAATIRTLASRIETPAVRERWGRIADQTDLLLAGMSEDGKLAAAPLFNERLLEPLRSMLVEDSRHATPGAEVVRDPIGQSQTCDLPTIERAVDAFSVELNRTDLVDLPALDKVLEPHLYGSVPTLPGLVSAEPTPAAIVPPTLPVHVDSLEPGELQILPLLAQRLTDQEIAERLFISPRTAGNHATNILNKLGLARRRDVAVFAAQHDLLPLSPPPPPPK